jgi:nucleoside-diphosphate-sugar epimerase
MARVFVTGGSGFVGRNLIAALRARGDQVRALARSDGAARAVRDAGAEPVHGDLDASRILWNAMNGCSVVFHVAATVADWGRAVDFHRINVEGTERVIEAALSAHVRRLVHVSTEAVLVGGRPIVRADESWPRPARPIGLYPLTKGLAEERVLAANAPALSTVIMRPRFIWGAGDTTLLPNLVERVRAGQFRWIGGGRFLTSTCHVANVCEGLLLAAERGGDAQIYFLTDGEPIEMRGFLAALLATQGVEPGSRSVPRWLARALAWASELAWRTLPLGGEPPITRTAVRLVGEEVTVDDGKARRELGYVGRMSREAGLAAMKTA